MSKVYFDDLEVDCAILAVPEQQSYRKQEWEYYDEYTHTDKTGSGAIKGSLTLGIYDTNHRIISEQIQQICETRDYIYLRTGGTKLLGNSNKITIIQTKVSFDRPLAIPLNYTIVNLSFIIIGRTDSAGIKEECYVRIKSQSNDWDVV
jgi:hypothetical protein